MTTYTPTTNEVTPEQRLDVYVQVWTAGYEAAEKKKAKAIENIQSYKLTDSFSIDDLIVANAQIKVYGNLLSITENLTTTWQDDAQAILAHITNTVTGVVCRDSFPNSTSNVNVEMELRERQVWCSIATQLNNF